MPPTLDIPVTIADFRAWEYGDKIMVAFTFPALTTENLPLKNVRSVEVGINSDNSPVKLYSLPVTSPGPVTHEIPAADWIGKLAVLAVHVTGPKGKYSEWSNPVSLVVIQPLAIPSTPKLQNVAKGVELTWTGTGPRYRIFRAEGDGQPQQLADVDGPPYLDVSTSYETRYRYRIQAIAGDKQWSVVSEPAEITPVDTFPPAVPEGLSAVPTPQSIELTWTRNTESGFRGYNVFRSVDNRPFEKIGPLIEAPYFSDSKIESGKRYRYTVSAVDLTGNESPQSQPADATAQ
jgi:hypothetical protein